MTNEVAESSVVAPVWWARRLVVHGETVPEPPAGHAPFEAVHTLCPDSARMIPFTSSLPAMVEGPVFVPMKAFAVVVPRFATPCTNMFPVEVRKPAVIPVLDVDVV